MSLEKKPINLIAYQQTSDKLKRVLNKLQYLGIPRESILEAVKEILGPERVPEKNTLNSVYKQTTLDECIAQEQLLNSDPNSSAILDNQEQRGRKKGLNELNQQKAISALQLYETGMSVNNILTSLDIKSKSTFYKYLKIANELEISNSK